MESSNVCAKVTSLLQYTHTLMMTQNKAESTREPINHGRCMNQFWLHIITSIQQLERINTKICRQKMSILFNQICLNKEILPKYTYFKLHDPAVY